MKNRLYFAVWIVALVQSCMAAYAQSSYFYYSLQNDPWTLIRRNSDGSGPVTIYTPPLGLANYTCVDGSINKVYFVDPDIGAGARVLYATDLDGANRTALMNPFPQVNTVVAGCGYVFYSLLNDPWTLVRRNADGSNPITVYTPPYNYALHVAVDGSINRLYYYDPNTDNTTNRVLFRANLDGSGSTIIHAGSAIYGLTAGGGYVYYANQYDPWTIVRLDSDGSNPLTIYLPQIYEINRMAYDGKTDKLYFYDRDVGGGRSVIYRCDPDGQNLIEVVGNLGNLALSLAAPVGDAPAPNMQVLGTNRAVIASGEAVSVAKGTDFGTLVHGGSATHTLAITNNGTGTLMLTGAGVSGAGAAGYAVQGLPAGVAAGTVSNFDLTFNPPAAGAYPAAVTLTNNSTNAQYVINVTGSVVRADQTIAGFVPTNGSVFTVTDGAKLAATASSGLAVSFAVGSGPATIAGGTNLTFTGTGTVSVVASQAGDGNWNPAANATNEYTVNKGTAQVYLQDLSQTYDGTARTITATTMPAGLTVEFTYDGGPAAPTNAGTYAVTGTVNATMYQGSAADSLVVGKADQTITFDPIAPQKRSAAIGLSAMASSGLVVSFSADPPGSIAGGTNLTFTGVGDVAVVAAQAGDGNYNAAPGVTNVVKVFSVVPDNGPLAGDVSVTVSNGQFGTITNVLVAGDAVPFVQGGSSWFTVTLPAASGAGTVDFTVQTSDLGEIALADAYGYHPAGRIGIREDDWTQWEEVAGLPAPRAGLAAASWNGLLYAIGGRDGVTYDRTNMFAFNGTRWQEMAGLPTQRYYLAVGTLNGKMHQVAGWAGGAVTSVFRYNGTNWLNVAALPTSMAYNAAATWGGELYSIGGVSGAFARSNVFRYNGTNWSVAAGLPGPRQGLAAATLGGAIYALGGNDEMNAYHSNVYRYAGTDWQEVAGLPAPRFELAAATLGDSLYAIGGRDGGGPHTNVYRYDGTNWQEVASLPTARYELAAATYDNSIYAFGGRNGTDTFTTNVYRYPKFTLHPGVNPSSGSGTGGYQVVISGTNLGDGADITNVTLGGVSAAILPGQSATQVVVTAGTAGAAGLGAVRVFSASFGETVASNAFQYLRVEQAALGFAPASPQAYGATNGLSTSGGSGTGAVSYAVQSGPGLIVGSTNLAVTASAGDVVVVATKAQDGLYFAIAATATVAAAKADQTINFPAIGDQLTTAAVGLAATASSGLPVSFAVGAGPATITGLTNLTFTGTGAVSIVASQAGAADWNAAPDATNAFNVVKAAATVYLLDLAQTYDGTARTVTATTMPAGLTVEFTYAGGASAPTNAGSYAVTGTVNDANWQGSAADLLVVGRAYDTITFFETNQFYDGTARPVVAVIGSGSPVTLTYDGLPWAPTNVGVYSVTGVVDEANWQAIGAEQLTVFKGNPVITNFLPADGAQFVLNSATTVSAQASSGLAVDFENLSPEIAVLVGTDIVFTNPGVAQVRATQAGDANWNAATPVVHEWRVGGLITNVAPGAANVGGGIDVVIQGVALGNGADITNVTLAGVAATIVTQSVGDVTVTVAPAASATTGDVTVASATGGFMVLSNAFEYLWLAAPTMLPATDVTLYDLTAHWTGVAGATAYFLDVGLDAGFAAHLPGYELRNVGAATNGPVDGLLDETDYWLRAYSWNAAGLSLASPALMVTTPAVAASDFDADGRADLAVYQTATGDWKFRSSGTGASTTGRWGWAATLPVPADYDGDGVSDLAVYHPATGNWHIRHSTGIPQAVIHFGWSETVPVPGDYDGDGTADLAVYHAASGRWYFRCSTAGDYDVSWGWSAAVPVPADYDGDGRTDVAVYHPATGDWYILKSLSQKLMKVQWGWRNAVPVPGDYEGDGKADIAVYCRANGNWHIRYSSGIQWQVLNYGWAGTIPVQADYDGDGTTDRAIYHPATGNWSIRRSSDNADTELQLGGPGHVPVLPYPLIHAWFGLP